MSLVYVRTFTAGFSCCMMLNPRSSAMNLSENVMKVSFSLVAKPSFLFIVFRSV